MCCFVILLLFNEMQMSVQRFSTIPHLREKEAVTQLQLKKLKTETMASNSFNFEFNTRLFDPIEAASKNILKGNYSAANYRA